MQVEMSTSQTPSHTEMREGDTGCYHYYCCCSCRQFQRIHCASGTVPSVLHVSNHVDRPTALTPILLVTNVRLSGSYTCPKLLLILNLMKI